MKEQEFSRHWVIGRMAGKGGGNEVRIERKIIVNDESLKRRTGYTHIKKAQICPLAEIEPSAFSTEWAKN
jgi:hypothetical protein